MRYLLAFFALTILFSCEQPAVDISEVYAGEDGILSKETDKPFTGVITEKYSYKVKSVNDTVSLDDKDYKMKSRQTLVNGKLDGLTTRWYSHGDKEREGSYVDGKEHGVWTFWHPNGELRIKTTFDSGAIDGKWLEYYDNGQLWAEFEYNDGKLWTSHKHYYKDGKPVGKNTLKDGSGKIYRCSDDGQVIKVEEYSDGDLVSETPSGR